MSECTTDDSLADARASRTAFPTSGRGLEQRNPAGTPSALVLVLHGGTQHSTDPVEEGSGSLRRMQFMRNRLAPGLLAEGRAVWLLRYSQRGWNAETPGGPAPISDARWALAQVRSTYGEIPVVLLGHSMGGRTAAQVADDANVIGVVALAPWFDRRDPVRALTGRHLVAGHGARDRITSARMTRAFVDRASGVAASAEFHGLGLAGHYMLYRPGRWNRFARQHIRGILERDGV